MSDQLGFFGDEPSRPECAYCHQPIEWASIGDHGRWLWLHMNDHMARCLGLPGKFATPGGSQEEAHARRGDPVTSHMAAASIKSEEIRRSQQGVLSMFERYGPMHDVALVERYMLNAAPISDLPQQSESGVRTRRSELVTKGVLEDSGRKEQLPSGRKAIVWRIA